MRHHKLAGLNLWCSILRQIEMMPLWCTWPIQISDLSS
jgi:hypothetical protein